MAMSPRGGFHRYRGGAPAPRLSSPRPSRQPSAPRTAHVSGEGETHPGACEYTDVIPHIGT